MTQAVRIVEVGPRDGLQNEPVSLSAPARIAFVERLIGAGLRTIEVGSFVSPKWVPQMAHTDQVLEGLRVRKGIDLPVLVPNEKGLDAAIEAGAREVAIFAAASEAFSRKNINCSIAESIERFRPVSERAQVSGIRLRGYISCVLGCPYQGDVLTKDVISVAAALERLGCYEVSLGDTIGVGTPYRARALVKAVSDVVPMECIAVHFHDTFGQALANLVTALEAGVRVIDAAAGGLGGCPYAKGASGNVATEAVVYMLAGMGMETGVDLSRLLDAVDYIAAELGRTPQSNVHRAMRG